MKTWTLTLQTHTTSYAVPLPTTGCAFPALEVRLPNTKITLQGLRNRKNYLAKSLTYKEKAFIPKKKYLRLRDTTNGQPLRPQGVRTFYYHWLLFICSETSVGLLSATSWFPSSGVLYWFSRSLYFNWPSTIQPKCVEWSNRVFPSQWICNMDGGIGNIIWKAWFQKREQEAHRVKQVATFHGKLYDFDPPIFFSTSHERKSKKGKEKINFARKSSFSFPFLLITLYF